MLWLIETDIHSEDMSEFKSIIESNGDKCIFGNYTPFEKIDYSKLVKGHEPVITLGSLQLSRDILKSKVKIGAYCNLGKLKCSSYYPHFNKYLLNSDYFMLPFGSLINNKDLIYKCFGVDDHVFIRPDSGFKQFTGAAVEYKNFEKDVDSFGFYDFNASLMCVVSSPKNIINEYRFFVANKEIIGSTSYRIDGEICHTETVPIKAANYLCEVLDNVDYRPDPIFCIDIAQCGDEFYVIELNSFSSSGLYNVDKKFLIDRAREHILEDYADNYVF